jgi:uncharacterized protein DUF6680
MHPTITDSIQAGASFVTMVAALAALLIASKAPRLAAKFAEKFRSQSAANELVWRFQLQVFTALMAHRSEIMHPEARAAINTVDVAFGGSPEVRNARRLFIDATLAQPSDSTAIVERYHGLIEAVARALNLTQGISGFDIRAGYYPEAVAKLDAAAIADAEEKLARRAAQEAPKENAPTPGAFDAYKTRRD